VLENRWKEGKKKVYKENQRKRDVLKEKRRNYRKIENK